MLLTFCVLFKAGVSTEDCFRIQHAVQEELCSLHDVKLQRVSPVAPLEQFPVSTPGIISVQCAGGTTWPTWVGGPKDKLLQRQAQSHL